MKVPRSFGMAASLMTALILMFGILLPVARVLGESVSAIFGLNHSAEVIHVWRTLWITFQQAAWSTGLSTLGIPLGWLLGIRLRDRAKLAKWVAAAFALTYAIPTVVVASAWITWLGRSGFLASLGLDWAYSFRAVVLAHAFLNLPWLALRVAQARAEISVSLEEAAATLGASRLQQFRWVVWPGIRAAVFLGIVQVFQLCVTSFGIVLILGGGPPVQTLETEIYSRIRYAGLDLSGAAVFALWQMVLTLPLGVLAMFFEKHWRAPAVSHVGQRSPSSGRSHMRADWFLCAVAGVVIGPYLILSKSLTSLISWTEFVREIAPALWVSIQIAFSVGLATVFVSGLVLIASSFCGKWLAAAIDFVSSLPSALSVLVLSLGFWMMYQQWLDPFEGSRVAMVTVQAMVFLPFALRFLRPLRGGVRIREIEIAQTLGASPFRAWFFAEWPRWRRPVLVLMMMVAAASLGEVAVVSLFYSEKLITLPVLLARWMSQYRFEQAQALAFVLLLLAAGFSAMGSVLGEKR